MQLPKLTPRQSRFVASVMASIFFLTLYLLLTRPTFAYAAELDSRIPSDHNHPITTEYSAWEVYLDYSDEKSIAHELSQRAAAGVSALANNAPQNRNIATGETQYWVFSKEDIDGPSGEVGVGLPQDEAVVHAVKSHTPELRRRQSEKTIYITINVCLQPTSSNSTAQGDDTIPPQLQMYLSTSTSNQQPGAGSSGSQQSIPVSGGYGNITMNATDDVYVGISAPNTTSFDGIWNYVIAASIDAPFHQAYDKRQLHFVDADNHAALFITDDLTDSLPNSTVYQEWMSLAPPYGMFAHDQNDLTILGISRSYCGLQENAKIAANIQGVNNQNVAGMTNRGLGAKPKEQFYLNPLETSTPFWGFLVMQGNSTAYGTGVVGGGGTVWGAMNFTTKTEANCALMYNLTFCSEVAYAVPSNPDKFSPVTGLPELAAIYDSGAAGMYQNFNYSLQQIPCNTTPSAQYSLARNCDDCARAYKQWLCAVTIPRCEDWNNNASWLLSRNMAQPFANGTSIGGGIDGIQQLLESIGTNSSRNPVIDTVIQPGPYKEVLPCEDLCYDLVQSCPAALGFTCPQGRWLDENYGKRSSDSGIITCSYLGAAYYLSGSQRILVVNSVQLLLALAVWVGVVMS